MTERHFDAPGFYAWLEFYTWRKVFAWHPVKTIGGKWVWLRKIYKQHYWTEWGVQFETHTEYAELFDVLTYDYNTY
jgi:hypothetical protein